MSPGCLLFLNPPPLSQDSTPSSSSIPPPPPPRLFTYIKIKKLKKHGNWKVFFPLFEFTRPCKLLPGHQNNVRERRGGGGSSGTAHCFYHRVVPDFPKPGIMFQDITTLLLDPKAFKDTMDLFVERYTGKNITVVAGVEARGFIFGSPIALAIGAKFIPLRKPNKLPGEVISEKYVLEYGTDCLQMHTEAAHSADRALVVDDLIATGGTLCAAINLLERVGAEVVECACVIELPELKGRERLNGKSLFKLVESH